MCILILYKTKYLTAHRAEFYIFFHFITIILDRGEGREKYRERNIDVREKHRLVAF